MSREPLTLLRGQVAFARWRKSLDLLFRRFLHASLVGATMVGCASPVQLREPLSQVNQESTVVARGSSVEGAQSETGILSLEPIDITTSPENQFLGSRPRTLREEDLEPENCRDMTLDEAIYHALTRTRTLRDLGGMVLTNPDRVETKYGPSIAEADPRFGVEAVLSEFDARLSTSGNFEKNDRAFNNIFFGGGTRLFQQDLHVWQTQISKTAATGTEFSVRNFTDYNANNAPGNQFGSAWNSNVEMEFRHPLLQRGGVDFNEIAGPKSGPGFINGVRVARTNARISQAEFETGLRDYLSNVANAYWDLHYAYLDHNVKEKIRNQALDLVRKLDAQSERVADDQKALAKEQFFRFQEDVLNSMSGKQLEGTRTNNGSPGGALRGTGGIQVAERRLRLLIGWPITDETLIRPIDEAVESELRLDYEALVSQALASRPELKRQRLKVERRELELRATRGFLLPQLDATGRYRWRGFGKDLAGDSGPNGDFNSAWSNLVTGDFQEWQMGFELDIPLGFRRAHAAVHHAELNLARDRTILFEQERQIVHDVSNSIAEVDRAYLVCRTAGQRFEQTNLLLRSLDATQEASKGLKRLPELLDAQRRNADAESRYYLARTEYEVAVKNVFYEAGTLPHFFKVITVEEKPEVSPKSRAWARGLMRRIGSSPQEQLPESPLPQSPAANVGEFPQDSIATPDELEPVTSESGNEPEFGDG